ncbi:MAG: S41 family peptidase [Acidobacteriota bacterium]
MNKHPLQSFAHCLSIILLCLVPIPTQESSAQSSPGQTRALQTSLANPDFELGNLGQVPDGWISPTSGAGYAVELVEENPKSGKRAALIRNATNTQANAAPFGNLMQSIDATSLRARRVRFRTAVRIEGADPTARAQLWFRVDRPARQMGFFDNMNDRPVTSGQWQYYEIVGDIAEDASTINIGLMLMGKGKAWLDDVSLTDLGKPVMLAEPARPLHARGLENLTAFTRLLGYVRHFHPSDEAAATDWNVFAVEGVRVTEPAKDAADLAQKLETLFRPLAPSLRVFPTGKRPTSGKEFLPPKNDPALKITSYRHKGYGQKSTQQYNIYHSERAIKDAPVGKPPADSGDPQKPFAADLAGGVSVLMPLALYVDAKGTLPRGAAPAKSSEAAQLVQYSGNDRATRLADVALAWNIFQHFYPYFDVVKTDWPHALKDALTSAATDKDEKAFLNTLRRMVAALHDGHGGVYHSSEAMAFATPVVFAWIEDRLVITQVAAQGASGLQAGDVVLKIDGKNSAEALAEAEALISGATPQWRRHVALRKLRGGAKDSELKLDVQPLTGTPRTVVLRRDSESLVFAEMRPPPVNEIKPGIYYLDLDRIKDEDFQTVLPKLEQARGIIFDLRGYPKVSPTIISHLIDKPAESARWLVPIINVPDQKGPTTYNEGGRWTLPPIAPRLKAKIAFITDGRAISYAESYMGIIEAYKLAAIVGEPTAGTNGNVNPFFLPGGYTVAWTGMKVLKHDGSTHHGVGIQPTVPVSRTIRGVAEGRDEQLERAIAIVSE